MNQVALLGDSIFDNSSYVICGHSVKDYLAIKLDEEDCIDLLAVDGSITDQVFSQVSEINYRPQQLSLKTPAFQDSFCSNTESIV